MVEENQQHFSNGKYRKRYTSKTSYLTWVQLHKNLVYIFCTGLRKIDYSFIFIT